MSLDPAGRARREHPGPYDAIVVGGGHNGLVHAGYLAKAGLRTLVLERRHLVGGAAITEELMPGFHFTTFSYALSLLRPEIIQELDLVEHGFMPLMMPSGFHPTGDGDHLLFGDDHAQNVQEIRRHSPHDADAYERYHHDLDQACRAIRPLFDNPPPDVFSKDPEDAADVAWLLDHQVLIPAASNPLVALPASNGAGLDLPRLLLAGAIALGLIAFLGHRVRRAVQVRRQRNLQ